MSPSRGCSNWTSCVHTSPSLFSPYQCNTSPPPPQQSASAAKEAESKLAALASQLDAAHREAAAAASATSDATRRADAAEGELKELSLRAEFLRNEREKLLKASVESVGWEGQCGDKSSGYLWLVWRKPCMQLSH